MAEHKPSYDTQRVVLGNFLPLDTPFSVVIDASERCNFKCNYCFRAGEKDKSWSFAAYNNLMSWETFINCVAQLQQFPQKIKTISLSGQGEPLCNPRIVKMAQYLRASGVCEQLDMHTNASLLTEESAKQIAQAGFTRIIVSLQGLDALTYKKICGAKIDFNYFYKNLEILYHNKADDLKICIKIVDTAFNKEHFSKERALFYTLFENMADSLFVEQIVPIWNNQSSQDTKGKNKFNADFGHVKYCPTLFYKLFISPEGSIFPCTRLPVPADFGNIASTTLIDAWNGKQRLLFLKEHLRQTRHQFSPCSNCNTVVNCIMAQEDIIDTYRDKILSKIEVMLHDK